MSQRLAVERFLRHRTVTLPENPTSPQGHRINCDSRQAAENRFSSQPTAAGDYDVVSCRGLNRVGLTEPCRDFVFCLRYRLDVPVAHSRIRFRSLMVLACTLLAVLGRGSNGFAQLDGGGRPPPAYYNAFAYLHEGRFKQAQDAFRNASRGGLRTIDGRWVDAVCYHVMIGEALFQQGNFDQALRQYNDGLSVFLANPDWLRRVQFPPGINPAQNNPVNAPDWARTARARPVARLPQAFQVVLGNANNESVIQRGGVVAPPELHLLNVPEVIRCTALALRRRRQILGPLCVTDPLSATLVATLDGRIGPVNHWSQAWTDVLRAMALLGLDKYEEAQPLLRRSLTLAGQYDHPLTPMALFELGRIAEKSGDFDAAEKLYLECSLSAGYFEQITLVEESLRQSASLRLATSSVPFPELQAADRWATRYRYRHLSATLSRLVGESLATAGEPKAALMAIEKSRKALGRRPEMAAQLAADQDYVSALANYQQGKPSAATKLLKSAIAAQQSCSTWLYQISLANNLYQNNAETMSARIAAALYARLLREPTRQDWKNQPLETLAVTLSPDISAYNNWLEAVNERRELATAVSISESIKRLRFTKFLPLGGRLLSLRWLLEADEDRLTSDQLELRRDLLLRYPEYEQLSQQARAAQANLAALPTIPTDEAQEGQMESAAIELHQTTAKLENLLGQLALRREYCPVVFPPQQTQQQVQASLGPKQLLLSFTLARRGIQVVMLSSDKEATWHVKNPRTVRKDVVGLLRALGMHDDNSTLTAKQLDNPNWRELSAALTKKLIDDAQLGFWNRFDELIIVPDAFLWYLPFEALIVDEDEEQFPLISRVKIRYAPMMSLAVTKTGRKQPRHQQTLTVLGQMFPGQDVEVTVEEFEQMRTVIDGLTALPSRLPAPSGLLRAVWNRLLVLDDVGDSRKGPLQWQPARLNNDKGDNSLARWLRLPWGAPSQVLLPGFHSAAESGLRNGADGDDLLASITALMAAGSQTVLISRWRTGGQTSFDLMREFMQELPHSDVAEAWQRSVQVVREHEVDPRREPRLSHSANAPPIQARHPFFWAGYMVVDTGHPPSGDAKPQAPVEPSRADAGG